MDLVVSLCCQISSGRPYLRLRELGRRRRGALLGRVELGARVYEQRVLALQRGLELTA